MTDKAQGRRPYICKHDQIGRSCNICDLEEEVQEQQKEINRLRKERWELERGIADIHGQNSDILQCLRWYADKLIWIQGRYEGGVFFSQAEDDKGQKARGMLSKYREQYL